MPKTFSMAHNVPMMDIVGSAQLVQFEKDCTIAAIHAVNNISDPSELSDVLEMMGIKPYKSVDIEANRKEEKRQYKLDNGYTKRDTHA